MAEWWSPTAPELEAVLVALGRRVEYPPTPPIAALVARRLEAEAAESPAALRPRRAPRRLVVVLAVLGLLLVAGAAVAGLLQVGGISFRTVPVLGPALPRTAAEPGLGRQVTLLQARVGAAFPVAVPRLPGVGGPDRVYFDPEVPGGAVALVYDPGPRLPEIGNTGLGMVITEFGGQVHGLKLTEEERPPEQVVLDGQVAIWVRGPHVFFYADAEGGEHFQTAREVGSTLVFERGGVVYRIESALDRVGAVRVATALLDAAPQP